MILTSDVVDILKSRLDAGQNENYYNFEDTYKPAINSAIKWIINIINQALEEDKITTDYLKELRVARVFQTSALSRIQLEDTLWTIESVNPLPVTAFADDLTPGAPVENETPGLSLVMEDLIHVRSAYSCARLTQEEYEINAGNPFKKGNTVKNCATLVEGSTDYVSFAYKEQVNYYPGEGRNIKEIEIRPYIPNRLCTIFYIESPSDISDEEDEIALPINCFTLLVEKALNYIAYTQGNNITLYGVTSSDINSILKTLS